MTQADLDRQISRRTGESLSVIRGRGFSPLTPVPYESESRPNVVDWDEMDSQRTGVFPSRRRPR